MGKLDRYFAEGIGAFLLTLVGSLAVIVFAGGTAIEFGAASLLAIALAHGLILAIIVYSTGHISGAHANPAVTIGFVATGRMKAEEAGRYILSQLAGAGVAGLLIGVLALPNAAAANFGAPLPGAGVSVLSALLFEALFAAILVFVVLSTAADKRSSQGWHGFAIGMTLAVAILAGGYFSGASINPARSFGPALGQAAFGAAGAHMPAVTLLWIYIIGPMIGGVLGALFHRFSIADRKT